MPQDSHTEDEIAAMPTDEFRAWVKTLPSEERWIWRTFRRRLSQSRYEKSEKRMWMYVNTTFKRKPRDEGSEKQGYLQVNTTTKEEEMRQLEPGLALEGEALRAFLATLPDDLRDEYRKFRRRELGKRWRRENVERHRSGSKTAYERMKEDPERWEAYKARKRELMAERRKRERGES